MKMLLSNWRALSAQKRAIAIVAAAGIAIAIWFLAQAASRPQMALLYSGLDPQSAGEVLTALESKGLRSEVRGDAIYVAKSRRDSIRMELASDGLPKQGQAGFEILDQMNGFATTSEMFDAAFWRAKEGELAKTIVASPGVKSARVHLAVPKSAPFARNAPSPSGSVTVTMARGSLTREQAHSIRFIVALAVPGLAPDKVAVIDSLSGVVLSPNDAADTAPADASVNAREASLERNLLRLLEARVGLGNARVSVSIELNQDRETLVERILDPKQRAMTEREARERSESGSASGLVTVASNLPEGATGASSQPDRATAKETSETERFEVSETRRERVSGPGAIKRIQVAVLVNDLPPPASENGETKRATPVKRSREELEALQKLVAAAVGFDVERGDVVTIESMTFDQTFESGSGAVKKGVRDYLAENLVSILQLSIPSLVALILALFVLKPILTARADSGAGEAARAGSAPATLVPGEVKPKTPLEQLQQIAREDQAATTSVLQSWFEEQAAPT